MTEVIVDRIQKERELELIKSSIDKMTQIQHIEILKILKNNKVVKLNENKNGVYINLSFLPDESVEEMKKYVVYIEEQEKLLQIIENQKLELSYSI
jgi:cobyrinic acid a,c-diamide synthase